MEIINKFTNKRLKIYRRDKSVDIVDWRRDGQKYIFLLSHCLDIVSMIPLLILNDYAISITSQVIVNAIED